MRFYNILMFRGHINPFHTAIMFLYPLKTSGLFMASGCLRDLQHERVPEDKEEVRYDL